MSGPAIGARGQIGFAQEGVWGKKQPAPTFFVEMVSEGVVSELGSLVAQSLRPDRAVHKRIGGVESAGGDINCEIGPEGFGKFFKHALGDVETTRLDNAFALKVTDAAATSAKLTVVVVAGLATTFTVAVTGGTGTGVDLTLADADSDTLQEVMDKINAAGTGLNAYSVTSYQAAGDSTTMNASDYSLGTAASNTLGACAAVELIRSSTEKDIMVGLGWGCYQHVIDAGRTLPAGLTMEIGRDVAAFTYNGAKVNSLTLTADTGEILGGSFNVMGSGVTTASRAIPRTANTGNARNAFTARYNGEGSSCTLDIDKTNHILTLNSSEADEDLVLDISVPLIEPLTGVVYPIHLVGGLVDYLDDLDYIVATLNNYTGWESDASYLADVSTEDIYSSTVVQFDFDTSDVVSEPVTDGDLLGTDSGVAVEFLCDIVLGGAPGTATIRFSDDNGVSYGTTYTTSATVATEVRYVDNGNSGFTIFFPDDSDLVLGDKWVISSFKLAETADYSSVDPFAGFEGALTVDDAEQPIMGWNCTLNNNLYGDKYHLGSRKRASLPEQQRSVEGNITIEFDDLDLYRKFINGVSGNLVMTFTADDYIATTALGNSATNYSLVVRQPNMEYNGSTPVIADEGIITVDMPYVALYDDDNSIPELRITLVNTYAYL